MTAGPKCGVVNVEVLQQGASGFPCEQQSAMLLSHALLILLHVSL